MDSIKPTNATRTAAHIAVGIAAAIIAPKLTGKGVGVSIIGAIAVVFFHELLDAPVAKAMVNAGIQF